MLHEIWKCPCCGEQLVFDNQQMVRSDMVAEGSHFSRLQPKINLDIVKGSNQKEHVAMTRVDDNYHVDIVWEKD